MKTIPVTFERDEDGWWVASADKISGCHTQGRSIAQARERFREALSLFVDNVDAVTLTENVVIPSPLRRAVDSAREERQRAEALQEKALQTTVAAARKLVLEHQLSVRDAGELLGLSHQRVQQLVPSSERSKKTAPKPRRSSQHGHVRKARRG